MVLIALEATFSLVHGCKHVSYWKTQVCMSSGTCFTGNMLKHSCKV